MSQKVVIIGAVALGSKAACRFKRLEPKSEVILIDKDEFVSYGGCGIPFYVSGDVSEINALRETSFHMLRDESFFENVKGINILTQTKALAINKEQKTILIERKNKKQETISYDKLVIATGSSPNKLNIEGNELKGIYTVANLHNAKAIKEEVSSGAVEKVAVIGAGFIGLEMAEALRDMWGLEVSIIEFCSQIMPGFLSPDLAKMGQKHLEEQGIKVYLNEEVKSFKGENNRVKKLITNKREIEADLIIMAVGVHPETDFVKKAGIKTNERGAIIVNEFMQTSDPNIFAGGDCVCLKNLITEKLGFYPLGSLANREGRVIGSNLAGRQEKFEGVVGSFVIKIFEHSLAGAGLSLPTALREGFDAVSIQISQLDRAHFYPSKELMYLEIVVEKGTKRVLGIQGFGSKGDAMVGRINAVAALLPFKPKLSNISNLEFAYSPPFSSAMDIVNALANTAENFLDGFSKFISHTDFEKVWKENANTFFVDCRAKQNSEDLCKKYPNKWHSIPQDEIKNRINELPKDKTIILTCNTGVRSYEAQLTLNELGLKNNLSLSGGLAFYNKLGNPL